MGQPIYIGICGKAGAGKTTVGVKLIKSVHKGVCIPFAEHLKQTASLLGWDGVKDAKGRRLLQLLGTDLCRNCIDDDYWVKHWARLVSAQSFKNHQLIVADDVRFDNEAVRLLHRRGYIIEVLRENAYYKKGEVLNQHISEAGIQKKLIDYTITNNGTFAELYEQVLLILKDIKEK